MEKFSEFITEAKEEPYKLVVFNNSADVIRDITDSGLHELIKLLDKSAKAIGVSLFHIDFTGAFISYKNGKTFLNSFDFDEEGYVSLPNQKGENKKYQKPFEINQENTIIMPRGLGTLGFTSSRAWVDLIKILEVDGYFTLNTTENWDICSSKYLSSILFTRNKLRIPKTVSIAYSDDTERAFKKLNTKFPIILKSSSGTQTGVGVVIVESMRSLSAIVQMLLLQTKHLDLILQEYIETDYDVRAIVLDGKVMSAMKREVITGDVRSNVSLGADSEAMELTDLEIKDSIIAAKATKGTLVGVDFIPSKNREKEQPYILEVNSMPGFGGIEKLNKNKSFTQEILKHFLNRDNWT